MRFGLMKGCPVVLRAVVFADEEELPYDQIAGTPHSLAYMPFSLLLQIEQVSPILICVRLFYQFDVDRDYCDRLIW